MFCLEEHLTDKVCGSMTRRCQCCALCCVIAEVLHSVFTGYPMRDARSPQHTKPHTLIARPLQLCASARVGHALGALQARLAGSPHSNVDWAS